MEERLTKLNTKMLLQTLEIFGNDKHKERFMTGILKAMRESKYDIRRFNFIQLV